MAVKSTDSRAYQRMQAVHEVSPGPLEEKTLPLPLAPTTHASHSGVVPDMHVVTRSEHNHIFQRENATISD